MKQTALFARPLRRLATLLLLVALAGGASAQRERRDRATVPFTPAHGLIFLELDLPERGPVLALLDTGANASAVDPRYASTLPVVRIERVEGTTGTFDAELVRVEGAAVGSLDLPVLLATRRDLGGLLAPEGRTVDAILGSDALAGLAVTLDFEAKRIELRRAAPDDPREGVSMTLDNGIPAFGAELAGVPVRLRIDTGASLFETDDVYVNVTTRTWTELRVAHPELAISSHLRGTGADGSDVRLPVAALPSARIGPLELDGVRVIVQPEVGYFARPDAHGFVGNNFLAKLGRVTLDYASGRLRVGERPEVARRRHAGPP